MANEEHVKILLQGIDIWNAWREKHPEIIPDLSMADLYDADLSDADLSDADLSDAHMNDTIFYNTNLRGADLRSADLTRAILHNADFRGAILSGAIFAGAFLAWSIFGDTDLRDVKGFESVNHIGPSTIGIDTLMRSEGNIPPEFLKGAGRSNRLIEYEKFTTEKAIEYYSCFISYSGESQEDSNFAVKLYENLQDAGVRCYFGGNNFTDGSKRRYFESVRWYDTLLLVCSEHSIASQWIEHEVEVALARERGKKRTVLLPVRLDKAIIEMKQDGWPAHVRGTRYVGDFEHWRDPDQYRQSFQRLLRDLRSNQTSNSE
jgi:hypothetical protein